MKKELITEVLIQADAARVWEVFADVGSYPDWNPFIRSLIGNWIVGQRLTVRLEPPGMKGMTFKPRVLEAESGKSLRWLGHLLVPGIFDGEHVFELIDHGNGTTTFRQSESFRGILVPFMAKQLDVNTRQGFESMNNRLKELAEQQKAS